MHDVCAIAGCCDPAGKSGAPGAEEGSCGELGCRFEDCRPYLLLVARGVMGPRLRVKLDASDIVQETFLEAQRHLGRFRGKTPTEFRAWLREILLCRLASAQRTYLGTKKRAVGREVSLDASLSD